MKWVQQHVCCLNLFYIITILFPSGSQARSWQYAQSTIIINSPTRDSTADSQIGTMQVEGEGHPNQERAGRAGLDMQERCQMLRPTEDPIAGSPSGKTQYICIYL